MHSITKAYEYSKIAKLLFYVLLSAMLFLVPGCNIGPSMMRSSHLTYNDALQTADRQEMLLNIVRLRYNEGPEFLATSSISAQYTLDLTANAKETTGEDQAERTNLFEIGGSLQYSERPTITFTPRNEKEFTEQLISPIDLDIIFLLINYGWDVDRVLRLTSDGINGLRNDTVRENPSPNYELRLQEFTQTVKDMQKLQQAGLAEISFEREETRLSGPISVDKVNLKDVLNASKDDYKLEYKDQTKTYFLIKENRNLVLRFSKDALGNAQVQELIKRLKLASNIQIYRIINAPGTQIKTSEILKDANTVVLSTRSVLGTMAYLAQGVSVPQEHLKTGLVIDSNAARSGNGIITELFQVKVQKEKPKHASLAIPYKGYWFYIDECDISSKRTLGVLNSLMRLKIKAAGAQNIPVLTLPVGR